MWKLSSVLFFGVLVILTANANSENIRNVEEIISNDVPQEEFETNGSTHGSTRLLEGEIDKLVECLRRQILKGIPAIGISTLDPLKLPILPLLSNNKYLRGYFFLMQFQLEGLAGFEKTVGKLTLPGIVPRKAILDFGLKFPKIKVISNRYRAKMNLFEKIDVFGKGNLSLEFNNFEVAVSVEIRTLPLPLIINDVSLKLILPSTQAKITGLFHDDYMSDIISRQLAGTLTAFAEQEQERVNDFLNNLILGLIGPINELLKELSLTDIIDLIISAGANCQPAMAILVEIINKTLVDVIGVDINSISVGNYDEYIDNMMVEL